MIGLSSLFSNAAFGTCPISTIPSPVPWILTSRIALEGNPRSSLLCVNVYIPRFLFL